MGLQIASSRKDPGKNLSRLKKNIEEKKMKKIAPKNGWCFKTWTKHGLMDANMLQDETFQSCFQCSNHQVTVSIFRGSVKKMVCHVA